MSLLVLVNAMIPAPGETGGDWWGNTRQAEAQRENDARESRPLDADFDAMTLFLHDVPESVRAEAAAHDHDQSMTRSVYEHGVCREVKVGPLPEAAEVLNTHLPPASTIHVWIVN